MIVLFQVIPYTCYANVYNIFTFGVNNFILAVCFSDGDPNMGRLKNGYQITNIGHPDGFCSLCWKHTEERMAVVVVKKCVSGKRRKFGKGYASIDYPKMPETKHTAQKRLEEFLAESKAPEARFTLEELLYSFLPSFDYQLIRNEGLESSEVKETLLDEIEKEIIKRDWYSKISESDEIIFSVNSAKIRSGDNTRAPSKPSSSFCPDHNPNRSIKSRRCYQNDRKRVTEFEKEINRIFNHPTESLFAMDSDIDLQHLLQKAYNNIFPSTLDRIKKLKDEGKKQTEIANILQVSRQVVSNALRREKSKSIEAFNL